MTFRRHLATFSARAASAFSEYSVSTTKYAKAKCSWLFLALTLIASPATAEDIVPSERVKTSVVVREEPIGPPSQRVGALRPGERATLLESVPYFWKVQLSNGAEGFVSKNWTKRSTTVAAGPLQIHFIDVGQGDSTLILCPNGRTILADAGSTSGRSPDEIRDYIMRQIEDRGGDIDYLIVSHPDGDHYNLLREVLDEVPIGRAWYVGERKDYADPEVYDWINLVPESARRLVATDFDTQSRPNSEIDCGAAKLWILAAAVEHPKSRKNAMSIVLMVRFGDFEAIITGDATTATEDVIMSRYAETWLDVDVLRVGHHGSLATSTSKKWADTISPSIAVFSAGYQNTYGHPRAEVVDLLTPHTENVSAHAFRDWRANPNDGPRYLLNETSGITEGVYVTSVNRTIVMMSTGVGFQTTTNN